jgi:glucose/arabinose dehydrogenase
MRKKVAGIVLASLAFGASFAAALYLAAETARGADAVLTGAAAYGDFTKDAPGVWRLIAPADLPKPYDSPSTRNASELVARPAGALPKALPGFSVTPFVTGLQVPRVMRLAPNGDIFFAEVRTGSIRVIRAGSPAGATPGTFVSGLDRPFGIAFYPPGPNPRFVYVGTTKQIVRFPYHVGDESASGPAEVIVANIPDGGHFTRDVLFSNDGKKMFVSIGSGTNIQDKGPENEVGRADIIEFNPDGTGRHVYASGLRNAVSITFDPKSGELWACVNERDLMGDNLPPDYVTHVKEGAFYGWPYFYIGDHPDSRPQGGTPPVSGNQVTVPDVLLQPHSAPLGVAFYTGNQFPAEYRGDLFVTLHGSWNRATRTGYKIVRIKVNNGRTNGAYEDFVTGFVASDGKVWGRPVSLVVAPDGSLLMSDDGSGTIWRIAYTGAKTAVAH